ncbi:cell division FtsZ family protein, partial [Patescibacteria group bacterium]|nr:cell division FtsZ family protein [Patescibacteria group bacterium]
MAKKKKQSQKAETPLKPRRIKIKVIGLGGGGGSIVSEMAKGLKGVSFLVADTDIRTFRRVPKKVRTFQFGENLTYGMGTGMDIDLGQRAAEKERERIEKIFKGQDLSILIASLGGGVGSGASLVFAEAARAQKNITLGIFTLPFSFEGEKKMRIAKSALKDLRENLSGTTALNNEKIFKLCDKKTPLKKALSLLNQNLVDYLEDLIEILFAPGIINIDFADLRTILAGQGRMIYFGQGVGQGPNRVEESIKKVFQNPIFGDWNPQSGTPKRILFNISGGKDLGLREVEEVSRAISGLNPRAKIIFGISQNSRQAKKIKITLLGVGESLSEQKEEKRVKPVSPKAPAIKKKKPKLAKATTAVRQKRKPVSTEAVMVSRKKAKVRRSGLEIKKAE